MWYLTDLGLQCSVLKVSAVIEGLVCRSYDLKWIWIKNAIILAFFWEPHYTCRGLNDEVGCDASCHKADENK